MTRLSVIYSTSPNATKEMKNSRAAKKRRVVALGQDTKTFNQMCRNGEIPATRMPANKFYTYNNVETSRPKVPVSMCLS